MNKDITLPQYLHCKTCGANIDNKQVIKTYIDMLVLDRRPKHNCDGDLIVIPNKEYGNLLHRFSKPKEVHGFEGITFDPESK